ncbi:TetR/AcrR family transcriptional regulator [Parahaliea maris]|uniref:TetR/AcrR family transcriptional regulator n=1 Tax=Parahaliea maris TaxID=2716870 RepID=A0A5C9A5I3_9GAMM|nr:TetR/AcrR family transcriptional regulator [Parahaliea maris]TXS96155.1 TetR/AcrR family transcriptional regulator [Parahaliea maris]
MTATRQQQRAATRKSILDAAVLSFARFGYDGTHFREITATCGAQRTLILYHFQTKEQLWQSAAEEVERRFTAAFDELFSPEQLADDRAKIRHTLTCFVDALSQVPEYGQFYLREGTSEGPRMEWLSRHFAPPRALDLSLDDRELDARIRGTVLRDIIASSLVAFVTLGPLLDRSHANASRRDTMGLYPLSESRRGEFIDYLIKLIF